MNQFYTEEHISFIKANATSMTAKELTKAFNLAFGHNKSVDAIKKLRQRLGIDRSSIRGRPST